MLVLVSALVVDVKIVVRVPVGAAAQSRAVLDAEAVQIAVQRTVEGVAALHAEVGVADIVTGAVPVVAVVVVVVVVAVALVEAVQVAAVLAEVFVGGVVVATV